MPTPNYSFHAEKRHARLLAGISETTILQRGFLLDRGAQDMTPNSAPGISAGIDAAHGRGVGFLPGGALSLTAFMGALVNLTRADWVDAVIDQTQLNRAGGIAEIPLHRRPDDLSGVGASADTVPAGVPGHIKRVGAGTDWSTLQLASDLAVLPPPGDPNLSIPVDRIIAGTRTYPANSGFGLIFNLDRDFWGVGTFLRFYFGGPTPTTPMGTDGGLFCLSVGGNGGLHLYEHDFNLPGADKWALRKSLRWSNPDRSQYTDNYLWILPYAWDRVVLGGSVQEPLLPQILGPLSHAFPKRIESVFGNVYQADGSEGQRHLEAATGPGLIRMDMRRTARAPFAVVRLKYPASGVWVDEPFQFKRPYPVGTPIYVRASSYLLPGTGISVQLYDASTHAPLVLDPIFGYFYSNANQTTYYAQFTLTASPDRYSSPILLRYSVQVDARFHNVTRTPNKLGIHSKISLTNEDELGSDHVTGTVVVRDLLNQRVDLQTQDRQRSTVSVYDDANALITHLGEYEIAKGRGKLKGVPTRPYPNPNYRDYNVRLVGLWTRLQEARASQLWNFGVDYTARNDPVTHAQPPWRIVDAVQVLLNDAGFPNDEIDLPSTSMRFWLPVGTNATDQYLLQPGQPILPILEELIGKYLVSVLVRDPNAGPRGMWRAIRKPLRPWNNFLYNFDLERPGGTAGYLQTAPGAWGLNTTWIEKGTYDSWPEAPLANVVVVQGIQEVKGRLRLLQWSQTNQESIDTPSSADYIGHELPYIRKVDPAISAPFQASWLGSILYDEMAHRRLYAQFTAPLPFVTDVLDLWQQRPRPLRVYDRIYVAGNPFLLTSVDYEVHPGHGSDNEMGIYEGYFE